jgi:hypothetical protein
MLSMTFFLIPEPTEGSVDMHSVSKSARKGERHGDVEVD